MRIGASILLLAARSAIPIVACAPTRPVERPTPAPGAIQTCANQSEAKLSGVSAATAETIAARYARTVAAYNTVTFQSVCVAPLSDDNAYSGAGPGLGEPLDARVWNFRFGGLFGAASCGPPPVSPRPTCPPPQPALQVLLDLRTGSFVEMGTPPEEGG